MKYDVRFVKRLAATLVLVLPLAVATPALAEFLDIVGHWSAEAVGALSARGMVSGMAPGQFAPNEPVTRAQLARLLADAMGADGTARLLGARATRFVDVPGSHWAAGYIEALAERGIMNGYPGATFLPDRPVTRRELAAMLAAAAGPDQLSTLRFSPLSYVDRDAVPDWAHAAVYYVSQQRFMVGYDDGTFRPDQVTTRSEAAATIMRFLALRGDMWNASGTLLHWDPVSLTGVLHVPTGQDRRIEVRSDAVLFRHGVATPAAALQDLDQVWVVERQGKVAFLAARYEDQICGSPVAKEPGVWSCSSGPDVRLRPDTLLFVNGKPAQTTVGLQDARLAYVALDSQGGGARAVDAIVPTISGTVRLVGDATIVVEGPGGTVALAYGRDSIFFRRDGRMAPSAIQVGDEINVTAEKGAVQFAVVFPR